MSLLEVSMQPFRLTCSLAACAATLIAQSAPPPNDVCSNAIVIGNGTSGPFDNFNDVQGGPPWPCSGAYDVWFLWSAGGAGVLSVDTCGATFDTVLEIFAGTGCGALV